MSDPKIIEVMLVFHKNVEFPGLYFSTTEPIAIAERDKWADWGHPVVILPIAEDVLPLLRGQKVSLGPL